MIFTQAVQENDRRAGAGCYIVDADVIEVYSSQDATSLDEMMNDE